MIRLSCSRIAIVLLSVVWFTAPSLAAPKAHVISFGKSTTVQWSPGMGDDKPIPLKVRALFVDTRLKEYMLGPAHEITDRLFVIRRAFRMNDSLPDESTARWTWQRGGWLLVDRVTGRVSPVNLPEFDASYSAASWYRDYAAYCGVSDDGKKLYAVVTQIGRRKPLLKKPIVGSELPDDAPPDSACPAPAWQREPARVSFELSKGGKETFAIRGHVVDVINDAEEEEEAAK
jgi:hypothetical protein